MITFCRFAEWSFILSRFLRLYLVYAANFGCSFTNGTGLKWNWNAIQSVNKAIHEFNACIFVLLLNAQAHISHIDLFIALSFGFVYYVYYQEVIVCAARISKFFIFIFYRSDCRLWLWLQSKSLRFMYSILVLFVDHIRAMLVWVIHSAIFIWHKRMHDMHTKITVTAPFSWFNYNQKPSKYSWAEWVWVSSSLMQYRPATVWSRYFSRHSEID